MSLFDEARDSLSARGGRMTAERRLILETLDATGSHPSAEELYALIKPRHPDLNLSTVYRTLRWLEGQGLISARRFGEDRRQDRFDPALPVEHHHFICSACGCMIEFNDPLVEALKIAFGQRSGARVESASVVLNGLCPNCVETYAACQN
jgi:Fe2+ or Zn2+ uptake regulation protein